MSGNDSFDRMLAGWFETDAQTPAPTGDLDRVLEAARDRKPRPAWLAGPGSHWIAEAPHAGSSSTAGSLTRTGLRWSTAVVVLLVLVALLGAAILVGARLVQPPPPGRMGHLAYGLDGSIYVSDWNGGSPVRIAHGVLDPGGAGPAGCGSFWGEGPMWSPDGRLFAYRSAWDASCPATAGEGNVYLSDPDGKVVASFPGQGWLVSWSPDSTRVATSVDLGHTFGIYGLDGVRQALLAVPLGYGVHGDYDPVWSPDGMSLLVPIARGGAPSDIWELPIDGGTPRPLPAGDRLYRSWASSPDRARVAHIDLESLVVARADGSQARVLIPRGVTSGPVWSPTGDRIAYEWSPDDFSYDKAGNANPRTRELRVVDVASGTVTSLASTGGTGFFDVIRFSPEGDRILFSTMDANYVGTSLSSAKADGSGTQLLVTGTGWGDWQPLPAGP